MMKHKTVVSRDTFFESAKQMMQRLHEDETVTHVFVIAVHGGDETAVKDEHGTLEAAPLSFLHNTETDAIGAITVNNISAVLALKTQQDEANATRN